MESFHILNSDNANYQSSYDFNPADLADIPCPDDNCADGESSPVGDDVELPLPPGTSGDDFTIPVPPKKESFHNSNSSPSFSQNKAIENTTNQLLMAENNYNLSGFEYENQSKTEQEFEEKEAGIKPAELSDESKYSPSKIDSDEDNQDFTNSKPKVLGKEQAKKRLMAFSLLKQHNPSIKKQNKASSNHPSSKIKEKSNKGSSVQEQFRATVSAIEEEKKKMFQNMPSYLLLEMSELTKTHSSMSSSSQLLEKLKNENVVFKNKQTSSRNENVRNKKSFDKRTSQNGHDNRRKRRRSLSNRRSTSRSRRSTSRSKRSTSRSRRSTSRNRRSTSRNRRSTSRNRRSTSRSRRSTSRNRRSTSRSRRSTSRSRRSRSRSRRRSSSKSRNGRRYTEDKNSKSDTKESTPSKKFEGWLEYKSAGMVLKCLSRPSKNRSNDPNFRRNEHQRRSESSSDRYNYKPVFNYLTKTDKFVVCLQAIPADLIQTIPVFFPEKIIKFTRTKPFIHWAENPKYAKEYYMSREMLLENCDEEAKPILFSIIENKKATTSEKNDILEIEPPKSRAWYPKDSYLIPQLLPKYESMENKNSDLLTDLETNNKIVEKNVPNEFDNVTQNNENERASVERKISLVNDSYLSDEEPNKEAVVEDVEVLLDVDLNNIKIRSKWDSDYEGENNEKESTNYEEKVEEVQVEEAEKEKLISDAEQSQLEMAESIEKKTFESVNSDVESPKLGVSDKTTGNLVSEYEEFLKMVSVDSNGDPNEQKEKIITESKAKTEKGKIKNLEKSNFQSPKVGTTDWDQESDHEEKSTNEKMQFRESHAELTNSEKNEKTDIKLEKSKKKTTKKKTEKAFVKKKKLVKKSNKAKKKKYNYSFSEESTSDSYESASESDSDSESSKKSKKKKKTLRSKKKSKKDSSSESNSDSSESKAKKKKSKKKKSVSKRSSSSDSDDSDDQTKNTLLKQFDLKKQLIIKKIDEIEYIGDKKTKKKEKSDREKKKEKESSDDSESESQIKSGKKKKTDYKADKKKKKNILKKGKNGGKNKKLKKNISSSDSDSESSEESIRGSKTKKLGKRKRNSSESSDTDEKRIKSKSKVSKRSSKKIKKTRKSSSSSDSDDSDSSSSKKKSKKKENKLKTNEKAAVDTTEKNLFDESNNKNEEQASSNSKTWKKIEEKSSKKSEGGDWESSSSDKELNKENKSEESSWDEDVSVRKAKTRESEDGLKSNIIPQKGKTENNFNHTFEANTQLASEALKTSLSNFSFNENSFCSFGQELSRDFFLTERSYSNSGNINNGDNIKTAKIEPRPFQSVSKDSEAKKPADSELYSPGYSDSELSEVEITKTQKVNSENGTKDIYDPLECNSEGSTDYNQIELSSIPLPNESNTLLPVGSRKFENITNAPPLSFENSALKDLSHKESKYSPKQLFSPVKSCFTTGDFTPVKTSQSPFSDEKITPTKRQLMSVRGQQKLVSKAASVFQDESDEENIEPLEKEKFFENTQTQVLMDSKEKISIENQMLAEEKKARESREESIEKENRSKSREIRSSSKSYGKTSPSPSLRRKSRTPELKREKRIIRSDSFEIEPLKSAMDPSHTEQLTPVVMSLDTLSSEGLWNKKALSGYEFSHTTDNLIDHAESFDIYPSDEMFRNKIYNKDYVNYEKSRDGISAKDKRKSRSRSYSPKKQLRSKSPERRESPRNRSPPQTSVSPNQRAKSPFSPRRRKSPGRGYRNSRSPEKRKKSPSRSPRQIRGSSSRRSRSSSPRKYRSPKHWDESPRKKDSPERIYNSDDRFSPRKDMEYSRLYPIGLQNRIPVIGSSNDGVDMKLTSSAMRSPYEGFSRIMTDPSVAGSEIYGSFYEGGYTEYGMSGYQEEVGVNNLITVKSHDIEKINSPERLSLDQRIELELGVPGSVSQTQGDQYQIPSQVCPPFQEMNQSHFQNSYSCDNTNLGNDSFYQNRNLPVNSDFSGQYFNAHPQQPPSNYAPFQQYPSSQSAQNNVLHVGNIVEVVPTMRHPPPISSLRPTAPQIMQVGNVLQVVPSQKAPPVSQPVSHSYGPTEDSPLLKTQKATAVVAPSSIVPTPNPDVLLNPLIKAIQLEREKRRKEKEKRKAEREARRKARQLRREAKLMSVNEKLKKSVQNEGLMLGQEVEDDELLDGLDVPSPGMPVEIITVSSPSALPPAGKGILITAGFMPKPPSEKKEVKFADGICPGEGTSTSADEDIVSPPPKPKLPKEKRFKKKKTKVKKKVKVQIIRQIIQEEEDDEDDLSPPPPPPGDPPPVFFARFPFGGDAQFPVYQTQTTTTTLTTVQYPTPSFE